MPESANSRAEARPAPNEFGPWIDVLPPLAALLTITLAFRLWSRLQDGYPLGGFDEKAYFRFADAFRTGGVGAIRDLLARYPTDPVLSLSPLPLRISFVAVSALALSIGGVNQESMAAVSTLAGLATVPLAWLLFRRWYSPGVAWTGALLVAFASLETALARRSLQDAWFTLWMVATIYFFERTVTAKAKLDPWLLGASAICALLTKELAAFLFPVFAIAAWNRDWRRAVFPLILASVGSVVVLVYVAGGVDPLILAYRTYTRLSLGNDYMRYQQGEWMRYFVDLTILSPLVIPLFIASAMLPADYARAGHKRALIYTAVAFAVFSALLYKNIRSVAFLDVLVRGPAAAMIWAMFAGWGASRNDSPPRWRIALAGFVLAACIGTEVWQFEKVFVDGKVYDPVTINLAHACGMTP